jgi:hypothetical protein
LALGGLDPECSGFFEAAPGGVIVDGDRVGDLDVGAIARSVSKAFGGSSQGRSAS